MKKSFKVLSNQTLSSIQSGRRHSKAYRYGYYTGKAVQAVGVGVGIAAGIATFLPVMPDSQGKY